MERNLVWAAAIAAATVGGSVVAACLMPFVALATMAAVTLPRREGGATIVTAWAANQAIGFALLGYPLDAGALGWGVALGVAALVAFGTVGAVTRGSTAIVPLVGAAVLGFTAYEIVLYLYGLAAGGTGAFTPAIVALLARSEALWLAGLLVVREAIARLAPAWLPSRPAAA
jgi:hypothetical protein